MKLGMVTWAGGTFHERKSNHGNAEQRGGSGGGERGGNSLPRWQIRAASEGRAGAQREMEAQGKSHKRAKGKATGGGVRSKRIRISAVGGGEHRKRLHAIGLHGKRTQLNPAWHMQCQMSRFRLPNRLLHSLTPPAGTPPGSDQARCCNSWPYDRPGQHNKPC